MTDHPVTRVLVANRGEIARRVMATCHRLGVQTVAVCSDPDLEAPHVREADTAVRLPGAGAAETYLRADLLVQAALRAHADAVHPGYGFLSENADFARAVIDAGLTWIGPSPEAIAAMGSKVESKRRVSAHGVPVLPEFAPADVTADDLPVLVKASAGGGGRGMRVVRDLAALAAEVDAASAEAAAAFGDPTVFIEPLVEHGHHVEVQVMADLHGAVLTLGERECSIQRRHQKLVEESPSPLVERTPQLRERLFQAAVAVVRSVRYAGAGTVEFLAAADGRFWFLEMNTRLQVEHPLTECTTGLDLVELQLMVATGGRLPSEAPACRGAAVEVRLYAEDPAANWRPATGTLHRLDVETSHPPFTPATPEGTPHGIRIDAGLDAGGVMGVHYDPLLAKLIAWAPTRAEAVSRLSRTLTRARIHGVRTNRDLLVHVLRHPAFTAGETDTGFLDRHGLATLSRPLVDADDERLAAVAAAAAQAALRRREAPVLADLPSGWRNVPSTPQSTVLRGPGGEHIVAYRITRAGLVVDGVSDLALRSCTADQVVLEVGGIVRRWSLARYPDADGAGRIEVDGDTGPVTFTEVDRFPAPLQTLTEGSLRAPLPGTLVALRVDVGDHVQVGQDLLVVEAMKMQHVIRADRRGRVADLPVRPGSTVEMGAVLAVLTADGSIVGDDSIAGPPGPPVTQQEARP